MYVRFKPCMTNCVLCVLSRQELNTSLHCTMTQSTCPAGTFLVPCAMTQPTCLAGRIVSWSDLGSHLVLHFLCSAVFLFGYNAYTELSMVFSHPSLSCGDIHNSVWGLLTPFFVMWRHKQLSLRSSHTRLCHVETMCIHNSVRDLLTSVFQQGHRIV